MKNKIIGIDIGGTTIKLGLLNHNGQILEKWEIDTNTKENGKSIVNEIWFSISHKLSQTEIENEILGIGVGAPGFVDVKLGIVHEAVNIGWKNFALSEHLKSLSTLPTYIENDANLAALGENWKGAGQDAEYLVAITLGTGVGSGIIVKGEILNGANGTAAELGHIIYQPNGYKCNCGRVGCLDTIVSARGIVKQLLDMSKSETSINIFEEYEDVSEITPKAIFEFAKKGDKNCQEVIKNVTDILGKAISDVATIINPTKIIIGGGISKAGEDLLNPVRKSFNHYSLKRISKACQIELAKLGNDAGMIGAASLVYNHMIKRKSIQKI